MVFKLKKRSLKLRRKKSLRNKKKSPKKQVKKPVVSMTDMFSYTKHMFSRMVPEKIKESSDGGGRKIDVYSLNNCRFCALAKAELIEKGLDYNEYVNSEENDSISRKKIREQTNTEYKFFPRIFVDDKFIGGYRELQLYLKNF